jgi:hypothetical protein
MNPTEYAVWDICRSLSHDSGILYFSGRNVAARFRGFGKTGAYNVAASLHESGWFKLLKDSVRRKDGTWSPRQYKVLSHADWAAEHPDGCGQPVLSEGLEDDSPVPIRDQPVPIRDQPVLSEGHNLKETYLTKTTEKEPDNHKPVLYEGLDGFVNRFSKKKRGQREAEAPILRCEPVPNPGQVEPCVSSADTADWATTAIANTIGVASDPERSAWADGVRQLIDSGHSTNEILEVADFAHRSFKHGTVKREGPRGFVDNYTMIRDAYVARQGKTGQKRPEGNTA